MKLDAKYLERLLKDAAAAHHIYESNLSTTDEDWPAWYARYMCERIQSDMIDGGK